MLADRGHKETSELLPALKELLLEFQINKHPWRVADTGNDVKGEDLPERSEGRGRKKIFRQRAEVPA